MPVELEQLDAVFVITMDDGENRMNQPWLDAMNAALDSVDGAAAPKALVTTGSGKFYSNGLDLEPLIRSGEANMAAFVASAERLMARLLAAPYMTIAACNGHTFAAGAMLSLCHDFRVMRADRGFWCLPEVDLGIPFSAGMDALIKGRLPQTLAHEVMVTGTRYGGDAAAAKGIVTEAAAETQVLPRAIEMAAEYAGKAGSAMGTIKARMYGKMIELLQTSPGTSVPSAP